MSEINSKKRISINIISTVLQVLIVGFIYLLLYKFLLNSLGVEQLGVWSIVLAATSVANLANFGITSGLVKFIADYNAKNNIKEIPHLIFTAFIVIFAFFTTISILLFFAGKLFLTYSVEAKFLPIALSILPYSLFCLLINSLSGVFTSTLEGFQKNYLRNYVLIFSSIILLVVSYYLVPIYKLKGIAFAQIIQAFIMLIGSFLLLKKDIRNNIFNGWNWDKTCFKELVSFGLKFQLISISQMAYEPITKGLISKFGGLVFLGYYEMAARLVNQVRALIVNANQVMVPVVAHTKTTDSEKLKELYKSSMTIVYFINIFLISGLLLFTPIISIIWIGSLQPIFLYTMIVLCLSMLVNIMVGPAYFGSIGEGKLNDVLISHIILGVLNLLLGLIFGYYSGGKGVVLAWGISVVLSSMYIIKFYQKKRGISFYFLFTNSNIYLIFSTSLMVTIGLYFFSYINFMLNNIFLVFMFYITLFILFLSPYFFKKSIRPAFLYKITSKKK